MHVECILPLYHLVLMVRRVIHLVGMIGVENPLCVSRASLDSIRLSFLFFICMLA